MKKKVVLWFSMLLIILVFVGCDDFETTSSNNTEQASSEQSKSTSKKKKSKKKKKKKKSNSKKKDTSSGNKKVNKRYYDSNDENVMAAREYCDDCYKDDFDIDSGRAFDAYFASSKWISQEDEDGNIYVEFIGINPISQEDLSKDFSIKKGMEVHLFFRQVTAFGINLDWKWDEKGFVCNSDGSNYHAMNTADDMIGSAYDYYLEKTGQF